VGQQQQQQQQQRGRRRKQVGACASSDNFSGVGNGNGSRGNNHVLASHWCHADIKHVDSTQDDAMMAKKTFRNCSISQSHNQSLFYSAPKRCQESWPT